MTWQERQNSVDLEASRWAFMPELVATGFKIVPFGNEPVILVKTAEGDFRALAATCTHLDCIVEYRRDKNLLWCNCHGGHFDLTGRVVGGPPPRPLRPY